MRGRQSIEEFIRDHRSEFDDLKAPSRVWKKMDSRNPRVHPLWKWSAVAASALLLISIGYILETKVNGSPDVAGWKEYQDTEQYYQTRVQASMDKIKTLPVSDEVMADIQVLDDVYRQLRNQLLEDPNANAQILLNAMIRHQQQKLDIMEKILNRVDKYKTNDKKGHEM